jgi:hypothetical protein
MTEIALATLILLAITVASWIFILVRYVWGRFFSPSEADMEAQWVTKEAQRRLRKEAEEAEEKHRLERQEKLIQAEMKRLRETTEPLSDGQDEKMIRP